MKKIFLLISISIISSSVIGQTCKVTLTKRDVSCFGACDGRATATMQNAISFAWNTNPVQTSPTIRNLCAGKYVVTATDNTGCISKDSVTLVQPTAIVIATGNKPSLCGKSIGVASASASGGAGTYTYSWNTNPVQTTDTAKGLPAGVYTVRVTDKTGCSSTADVTVNNSDGPLIKTSSTNVSCFGGNNGVATVTVSGGISPFSYLWNTGQTGNSIIDLTAGAYSVTVSSGNNCRTVANFNITEPNALTLNRTRVNLLCFGDKNGSLTAVVTGGVKPYKYTWNTNPVQSTATISGLGAGNYGVTVTDSNGCQVFGNYRISQPAAIVIGTTVSNSACGAATGQISTVVNNGTGPFTYAWNTNPVQTTATATGLAAGTYTVTVTDANGCKQSAMADVSNNNGPIPTANATNVSCGGTNDGAANVTVTGGTAPYTYSWDTNPVQTTASLTGLAPGTYTVTVKDNTGCAGFASATVLPTLSLTTTQTNIAGCAGQLGNATVFPTGGTGPYTYSWNSNPVQGTARARRLVAGTYTVTVADAAGCIKTASVTITQPAAIVLTTTVSNSKCNQSTGQATVNASGGTAPYNYLWNTNPVQNTATATALSAGIYSITVNDINGCTATSSATVNNSDGPVPVISSKNISCFGGNDGTAAVAVSGGTAPYTYSWNTNPVQTTSAISNLFAGTYSVTITDATGCTALASAVISSPTPLNIFKSQTNVSCFGGSTGTATAQVSGGKKPYTFSWNTSPVQATATATGLKAGSYTLTVTDSNGCQLFRNYRITQSPALLITSTITNSACAQATGQVSATVTGGTGPYTYSWNTNPVQTTATATGLAAGSYTLTVTDANSCTQTAVANVGNLNGPQLSTSSTNISCTGTNDGTATVVATGGTAPFTYSWNSSPVQTTAKASGLAAGNYIVTVTDNAGCSSLATATVAPALSVALTQRNITSCNGANNGAITATATGGNGPYSYSWNTNPVQTTPTINRLPAGSYTVTVTDVTACIVSKTTTITQPAPMVLTTTATSSSCTQATGQASVSVTGGTPPYFYSWNSNPVQNTSTATALAPGAYTVSVFDRNNCFQSATANVNSINGPTVSIASINVTCNGGNNGTATATVSGGQTPYTYLWNTNPAQTLATASGLAAGNYNVLVTDKAGCSGAASTTITQAGVLRAVRNIGNVSCNNGNNGAASVTISGGTAPYTYSWNTTPVQTTDTIQNLKAGNYSVTVTDKNACSNTFTLTVRQPAALVASTSTVASGCGAATGQASVNVSGGVFPYTYSWNTTSVQTTATITNIKAGVYTVTVKDFNACTQTASATVNNANGPALTTSTTNTACSGGNTGTALVSANGGLAPYTYSWNSNPVQTTAQATALAAGTYAVTVTDNAACVSIATVTINGSMTVTTKQTNTTCNGGNNGSAAALVTGGTAPYSYAWNTSPVQNTATATQLSAGTYVVSVTDAKGCTSTASVTITEPAAIVLKTTASATACGQSSGTVSVTVSGGTPNYFYSWNTNPVQNTATATALPAGAYTVTVTDKRACTQTAVASVTNTGGPALTVLTTKTTCNGGTDGTATVTASGGTSPYTYSWNSNPVQTTAKATALKAGTYAVTVSDNAGCKGVISAVVTEPAVIKISTTQKNATCNGAANGSLGAAAVGGTGALSYSWNTNPVQTTAAISGLKAGTYIVSVKDSAGCTNTASATITEPGVLTATATKNNVSCPGGNNGSIAITAVAGGSPGYSYSWNTSPVQTTSTAISLKAGTYTVAIKDTLGCQNTNTFAITEPAALAIAFTQTNVSCNAGSDGTATAAITGGTAPYRYTWSTNPVQTKASITGLKAGSYTLNVKDTAGCLASGIVTITESAPLVLSTSVVNTSCGAATGSATVAVTGGTPAYTYSWNSTPLQKTATAIKLAAGAYTVSVTDLNGCSQTATASVSSSNGPVVSIGGKNINCNGSATGKAFVTVTGGAVPYTYAWNTSPVLTTDTIKNIKAGTYTATVTDNTGCKGFASIVITQSPAIATSASMTPVSCNAGSDGALAAAVTGGKPGYKYSWSSNPVQTTSKAVNLSAGTYSLTVLDSLGCKDSSSYKVTEPAALSLKITSAAASCNGGSDGNIAVQVLGGTSPFTYVWNTTPAQTTAAINGLKAGSYTVKVSDANACTLSKTISLTDPAALTTVMQHTDVSCYGGANGTATVTVSGGTATYKYLWNTTPAQKTSTANGLNANSYTVLVTDANGCQKTDSVVVAMPDSLSGTLSKTNPVCFGGIDGSISIAVTGGTLPITYSWNSNPVQTGATATGLVAGTYTVTVKDGGACQLVKTVSLTSAAAIAVSTTQQNVIISGGATGKAVASASGGTPGYSYSWSTVPAQTTSSAANLAAGNYVVTVTDNSACTATKTVSITEPAVLGDTVKTTDVSCAGLSDGKASATVSGGIPPYRYFWNTTPAKTTSSITGLAAGVYSLTVLDSAGASVTSSVTIKLPPAATIKGKTAICIGDSAVLTASSGTAYLWNTGATTASILVKPVVPTRYTIKINNGTCADSTEIQVTIDKIPVVSIFGLTSICSGQSTTLTASGGSSYLWNTKDTTATIKVTPSKDKVYTVKVSNSCSYKKDSVTVSVNPNPVIALAKDTVIYQGQTLQLMTQAGQGRYLWTPSTGLSCMDCNAPLANPSESTSYTVTVTSSKGCTASGTQKVTIDKSNIIYVPNIFSPNGDGENDMLFVRGKGIRSIQLFVYDRWGVKVFETTDMNRGWDGTMNGSLLNTAVYVYYLDVVFYNNVKVSQKGDVTLLR